MISILPLDKSNLEETIHCISRVFTHEPMAQILGIDANSFIPFVEIICQKAVQSQLSLIAKDKQSGNVIGFSLLENFITDTIHIDTLDPRFIIIMSFLDELDEWYVNNYPLKSTEDILRLFMFGVDEQYRGKKVANGLVQETINVAKSNGYKQVITEATGVISQGIFDKFGFKTLKEVDYKTYLYDGKPVFKDIKEQSCKLMERTFN